jgi:hypothetical protein
MCLKTFLPHTVDVDVEIEMDPADCEVKPAEAGLNSECVVSSVPGIGGGTATENVIPNSGDAASGETEQCPVKSDDAAVATSELKPFTRAKVQSVEDHKKKNCLRRLKISQCSSVLCMHTVLQR